MKPRGNPPPHMVTVESGKQRIHKQFITQEQTLCDCVEEGLNMYRTEWTLDRKPGLQG